MKKIILVLFALFSYNAYAQIPFQTGNAIQNRKVVLFQAIDNDHQYFGLGINTNMLRYQVDTPLSFHAFFTGTSATTSTELMRITGTGNVGIGTTTPNAPLQFASTFADRKIVMFESGNNNHQYFGFGIGNQLQRYQVGATTSSHAFFAAATATTSNELMRITGTGNVGIGTTAPNAPLQFANTLANRKIVLFEVLDNDHQYYGFGVNGNIFRHQITGINDNFAFFSGANSTTSNELMRITGTGNVGIGTTAPSERLHVAGSVRIVDGTQGVGKVLTSDANGKATWTTPAAGGTASELQKITEGSNTGWRVLGRDAANYGNIGSNALDLSTSTSASTTRGATGTNAFATGINTTASGLYATAMGESTTASGAASTAIGFTTTASNQWATAMGSSTTASGVTSTAMGNYTTASGPSSTAMGNYTTASGDNSTSMGISTRATQYASTAMGNQLIAKSATEFVVGSFNDTLTTFDAISYLGDNNRTFTVGTGSSNAARRTSLVVQQNGNVGIGASAPNAQLQLGNTIGNRKLVLFEFANNDHQYYGVGINNQVLRYQVDASISSHAFFAGATATTSNELMRITGTGNVGIGTTTPSERLHVAGSVRIVDGTQGVGKVLTSDANGKATWTTQAAGGNTSELQKIIEGGNTGWRILGRVEANHGNIGVNAIDFSISSTASTTRGATGGNSFSTGFNTTASGINATALGEGTFATADRATSMGAYTIASAQDATAMGFNTVASALFATAMGNSTRATQYASTSMGNLTRATGIVSTAAGDEVRAKSFGEFAIGSYNDTLTTVNSTTFAGDNNRIFTVGTGTSSAARRTSFVVQQNGNVGIGASSPNAQLQLGNTITNRKLVLFEAANNDHQYYGVGINNQVLRYQVDATISSHAFFAGATATTSNELMRIQGNGNVGIGTTTPSQRLEVTGNILASGTVTQSSDLRYKNNFTKIENPLNKVLALNGLHYDWRVEEFKENNFTKDRQIGFIAQEIEKIFPEMVQTDAKGYKSVDYARLTPVLVEAIKELKTLNDELKGKNEKLEANGQKIEARLNKIEALLYK